MKEALRLIVPSLVFFICWVYFGSMLEHSNLSRHNSMNLFAVIMVLVFQAAGFYQR